jgi:hypothetical protein
MPIKRKPAPNAKSVHDATREANPWQGKSVKELAAAQSAEPVSDFDAFMQDRSDAGPADEGPEDILRWLRDVRREGQ